ncbi:MAG: hypothetical protein K5770_07785 [Lachnospiraceae bacterium]|nr:hypothetical protein [Lachnospiraceae bacterium]
MNLHSENLRYKELTTLDEYKRESPLLVKAIKDLEDRKSALQAELEAKGREMEDCERRLKDLQAQYQAEQRRLDEEYTTKRKKAEEKEKALAARERRLKGRELTMAEIDRLRDKPVWGAEIKDNILKTAAASARSSEDAKKATAARKAAEEETKALKKEKKGLEKDIKKLEKQIPDFAQMLHYEALEGRVKEKEQEIEGLRKDIKVRDNFIIARGLKDKFLSYCAEIGHKLMVAVEGVIDRLSR